MKNLFECPICEKKSLIGKKLHGTWTCPNCSHVIIPTTEIRQAHKMPLSYLSKVYGIRKKYKRDNFLKTALQK